MSPAWLLDDRYEITLEYSHGYGLRFLDRNIIINKKPQEHFYFSGGGVSSKATGLHDVKAVV